METLVSSWYIGEPTMPEKYAWPPGVRPGNQRDAPVSKALPIIDLSKADGPGREDVIHQIIQASQEFGFFQVINHGVSTLHDAMGMCKEFFEMPIEDRKSVYSTDINQAVRLYTSGFNYETEDYHYWRDILRLPATPLEEYLPFWPPKPAQFRDIVGEFSQETKKLGSKLLELISEGLGLKPDYFGGKRSEWQMVIVNRYPPCPEPKLALGTHKHSDPNLLSILYQGDVYGLQFFKDGECYGIEPILDAFVINIAWQLQIISNGKLISSEHRAVTNPTKPRTTFGLFIAPSKDCVIGPAEELVTATSPPRYKTDTYSSFSDTFAALHGTTEEVEEAFKYVSQ
uniref:Fe2OG dioxygenase domain-containing protein n=1 Tax=Kalanchoe fedtschenkoi TaxID=63787 RepID=A0A7N0UZ33_KALFE